MIPSAARLVPLALVAALAGEAFAQNSATLGAVSGYGNFHAGGVVVTISGDVNGNASVALESRPVAGVFKSAHALARIDATHFVGSLFWLSPATSYEARVTLSDPDGVTGSPTAMAPLTTRSDTLVQPTLRTLYVAPSGNDGNPGTSPGAPKLTIQGAANVAQAGDLILIQPGVYRESVNVPASGTAVQPIVFRGNGAGVVLDGALTLAPGTAWSAAGAGAYSSPFAPATGHVVSELGRLFRYDSLADLQALGAGAPGGFLQSAGQLYVKFADSSSPTGHTLQVARFEDGIVLDGRQFVRVESLEIRHFGAGDFGKGVYLRFASDCAVRLANIHDVGAAGVWIKGGARNLVEDNVFSDTSIFNWPWDATKGSSAENNAVTFTDDVARGNVLRRNTISGFFNGVGPCGSLPPPGGVITNETDVYDNLLSRHTDDGFEPEGYCSNVRLWGNRLRDVHMAFAVAPAAPGPTYIVRNVAFRFGNTRTSQTDGYTASALKINSGFATPIGPLYLYHNTFLTDAAGTDAIALLNPGSSTFITARNNLFAGTRYTLYKVNPVLWSGDSDDLYTTDGTRFVQWMGTNHPTLAAFQALGQEATGLSAAPQLVNPVGGDYTPQAASLLVNRGLVLPGINDGYVGSKPDIGAIETSVLPVELLHLGID